MKLKTYVPLLLVMFCAVTVRAQEPGPTPKINLMPVPASVKFNDERLAVDSNFKVATRGHSDARLEAGIWRFVKRLEGRTVLTLAPTLAVDDQMTPLIIDCDGPGQNIPNLRENESYRIDITRRQAILSAPTVVGALRGLETLLQLLDADRNGYFFPGVQIEDQPRFPWRGLLIDVARHFQTMEVLKRNLDAMAARGTRFRHAYSACPSCIPARAILWSGLSQWHTGVLGMGAGHGPIPTDFKHTLPGELTKAGYTTHLVGKGHALPQRELMGFQSAELEESGRVETKGFKDDYRAWFGTAALRDLPELAELEPRGLATLSDDRIRLTATGLELSDVIGPWLYSDAVRREMEAYELR